MLTAAKLLFSWWPGVRAIGTWRLTIIGIFSPGLNHHHRHIIVTTIRGLHIFLKLTTRNWSFLSRKVHTERVLRQESWSTLAVRSPILEWRTKGNSFFCVSRLWTEKMTTIMIIHFVTPVNFKNMKNEWRRENLREGSLFQTIMITCFDNTLFFI